ncbi:transmembrane protein 65-like isoform X2 [Octopus sinensis]|uniref:Transmembrane protein 65-like isoform X2 n=1 Tax=Octopus sinensis TaxID=2607531 RepID=A0A7E6FHP5_9MOLL|nr:transmembrane protein 65-like isoform X2 [Octopus sinensis]
MAVIRPILSRVHTIVNPSTSLVLRHYNKSSSVLGRFGKARPPVAQKHLFLKDENARDFIYTLKPNERKILLTELTKFEEERLKTLDIDGPPALTSSQIRMLFIHNALPFVGFGFLDNVLMIVAGEYIDATFGSLLGISTMAAAGLGNMVSDVAGIGSAWYVEVLAVRVGFHMPTLTPQQVDMRKTRWIANLIDRLSSVILVRKSLYMEKEFFADQFCQNGFDLKKLPDY